jgi:hypothetical protein
MFLNIDLEPQVSVHDSNESRGDLNAIPDPYKW